MQEKIRHFGLDVSLVYKILSLYVLICFEFFVIYILRQNVAQNQTKVFVKSLCADLFEIFWYKMSQKMREVKL